MTREHAADSFQLSKEQREKGVEGACSERKGGGEEGGSERDVRLSGRETSSYLPAILLLFLPLLMSSSGLLLCPTVMHPSLLFLVLESTPALFVLSSDSFHETAQIGRSGEVDCVI